ncbi:MAG: chromosome segregation protein SMC [Chromatiales bacterium]|nr:chromosome segregation protein SMC [Chromatiales bacterium]
MKLEKIKLVGFKSFPDQVTIDIVSNMTAIVGPNGCGKSNIVDAVNWALGHDAREVRAAYADDVIFSGTGERKALGLAAIELLFDNSDNTGGGKYATYNEISIRRSVDRSRESKYYINNTRCRRRDIHDIFADTGLGPNGYAIIEQGMISRLIEAKPDEMRLYIEEVAGISKYRERKRDAELRMRHTRDNLARVRDIGEELDKQLGKLKRQAKDAERFKDLKANQQKLTIRVLALEYKQHEEQSLHYAEKLSELRLKQDSNQTEMTTLETRIQALRLSQDEWNDKLNQTRENFYALNAEIAGIEQDIANRRKSAEQLSAEQTAIEQAIQRCETRDSEQQQRHSQLQYKLQDIEQAIVKAQQKMTSYEQQLESAERKQTQLRFEWDSHHTSGKKALDNVEVYRVKIDYCLKELDNIKVHRQAITQRKAAIQPDATKAQLRQKEQQLQTLQQAFSQHEQRLQEHPQQMAQLQSQIDNAMKETHAASVLVQDLHGKLASLKALQEEEIRQVPGDFNDWLQKHNLQNATKIADYLEVDEGWEQVVEQVLGYMLNSVEVEALDSYIEASATITAGRLAMLESAESASKMRADSLAHKIKNSATIKALLANIYIVDHAQQAMQQRSQLADHESLVTSDGLWVAKHWLRLQRNHEQSGALSRRREIEQLQSEIAIAEERVAARQADTTSLRTRLQSCEEQRGQIQLQLSRSMNEISDLKLHIQQDTIKIKQQDDLIRDLDKELTQLSERESTIQGQHDALQKDYQRASASASGHDSSGSALEQQRIASEEAVAETRSDLAEQQQQLHQIEIEQHSLTTELKGLDEAIEQGRQQHADLIHRHRSMQKASQSSSNPIVQRQAEIASLINKRETIEATISQCNQTLKDNQSTIQEFETRYKLLNEAKEDMHAEREQLHGTHQAEVARCSDLRDKLAEYDFVFDQPDGNEVQQDLTQVRTDLEKIERKISRMGSINLIAIEEFEELKERKEYLDSQNQDLVSALETLAQAINKIDRESKEKFKHTFEQINDKLSTLFKRLFKGGYARLELVEQNWLESGVSIMVSPPGKKLSSIRLLSGGEKALAALAVIFAIFELRPAPFCILDEVDAPLDENNILNFCTLIKDLSNRVQFMIITHSRLTMENVDSLIGVTMAEPGVSRLVSVNVEEAAQMAGA